MNIFTSTWCLLVLNLGLIIGLIVTEAVVIPEGSQNSTFSLRNSQIASQDDDVFIPDQGAEHFDSIFDWNLLRLMARKYPGNLLLSPISLKLALTLLYEGAQDATAHELGGAMHLSENRQATRDKFSSIIRLLQSTDDKYKLNLATRIFMDSRVTPRQSFAAIIKTFYATDIISKDFSDARIVADSVNNWVKNITNGNIEKMIDDESTVKDSVMLMVSAMYLKGFWYNNKFSLNQTKIGRFYETNTSSIDVMFMNTDGDFYYTESAELDAKILRIPYVGKKFAMYLILPRRNDGIDKISDNVNPFVLARRVGLMQKLPVDVTIPKFKFEFTSHLEPVLRELGIRDIFDDTAILSGIAKPQRGLNLKVSDIIQKTGIEVNEQGTTAYAATEVNIGNKISGQTFKADHPFMFYIENEATGTILYIGRVNNPLESSGSTDTVSMSADQTPNAQVTADVESSKRYHYFNIELLQALADRSEGNVIFSPLSVKTALTIAAEGAGGKTREEVLSTLRLPNDAGQIRAIFHETLLPIQQNVNGVSELDLANRLWVNTDSSHSESFNEVLKLHYWGDIKPVEFSKVQETTEEINEWVSQATRKNIQQLIAAGGLSPETQMVLTSVLYFKGRWLNAFDGNFTVNSCFNVPHRGCQQVPMMENFGYFRYADVPDLKAEIIELPYADGRLSLLVMLPNAEGLQNLRILLRDLSHTPILPLLRSLRDRELLFHLPRFSVETKINLVPALKALGIRELFSFNANLSAIMPNQTSRIESVLHNAKIEVTEEGTIAAAASALTIVPLMGGTNGVLTINRPFLFVLVDRHTGNMIFAGRVVHP